MVGQHQRAVLRIEFVEMLFALTIAEVAIQVANVVTQGTLTVEYVPAYAHLILAASIVATSWVGWSTSKAPGAQQGLSKVFSYAFVVLSVDVLLVILYFIIARGVDIGYEGTHILAQPSATNETLWVMLIFAVYLAWDLLTKIVMAPNAGRSSVRKRVTDPDLGGRALRTGGCFAAAMLVWFLLRVRTDVAGVVLTDAALVALVFLFRALKQPHAGWSWTLGSSFVMFVVAAVLVPL